MKIKKFLTAAVAGLLLAGLMSCSNGDSGSWNGPASNYDMKIEFTLYESPTDTVCFYAKYKSSDTLARSIKPSSEMDLYLDSTCNIPLADYENNPAYTSTFQLEHVGKGSYVFNSISKSTSTVINLFNFYTNTNDDEGKKITYSCVEYSLGSRAITSVRINDVPYFFQAETQN